MQTVIRTLSTFPKLVPLSYSKAKVLLSCPLKYKLQYIDKHEKGIPLDKTSAEVGKFVHRVLETAMRQCMVQGFAPGQVDFDLAWMAMQKSEKGGLTHSDYQVALKHKDTSRHMFERICGNIVSNKLKVFPEAAFCMTKRGAVEEPGHWPTRFFFGYIDLFLVTPDYRALLLDYKTHSKSTENAELVDNQTRLYSYFMFKKYPSLRAITPAAAYIPDELIDCSTPILATDMPKMEADMMQYLTSIAEAANVGSYEAKECSLCKWCDYTEWCPVQMEKKQVAALKKLKKAEKAKK